MVKKTTKKIVAAKPTVKSTTTTKSITVREVVHKTKCPNCDQEFVTGGPFTNHKKACDKKHATIPKGGDSTMKMKEEKNKIPEPEKEKVEVKEETPPTPAPKPKPAPKKKKGKMFYIIPVFLLLALLGGTFYVRHQLAEAEIQRTEAITIAKAEADVLAKKLQDFYKVPIDPAALSSTPNVYKTWDVREVVLDGKKVEVGFPMMETPVGIRHYSGKIVPDIEVKWRDGYRWDYFEIAEVIDNRFVMREGIGLHLVNARTGQPTTHLWAQVPIKQ